jgi:hypothetical protein
MNEKVFVGPKFGTLIHRNWITNIWVVTSFQLFSPGSLSLQALKLLRVLLFERLNCVG